MASSCTDLDKGCVNTFITYVEKALGKELPPSEKKNPGCVGANTKAVNKLLKEVLQVDHKCCNYMDASIFPKLMNKTTKKVTADQFVNELLPDLATFMAKHGHEEEKLAEIKEKITKKGQDILKAEKPKNAAVVNRLTDVKGYTGSHKERFDADTGKGKGMEGRVEKKDGSGYVCAYKGGGTYDKTH